MKPTDDFKKVIQAYLEKMAESDEAFLEKYTSDKKNIDDCCTYILNQVQKSGQHGFTDPEIFGMAVHYYDEENIDVGKPITNVNIVTNHKVKLSEADKQAAKNEAIERLVKEEQEKLKKKAAKKATPTPVALPAVPEPVAGAVKPAAAKKPSKVDTQQISLF